MATFPRPATTHRLLKDPTVAHLTALEAAYSIVTSYCQVARDAGEDVALGYLRAATAAHRGDVVDVVADQIRRPVRRVWDDDRDSHDDSKGRFSVGDGTPEGAIDVCRSAALIACSVVGLVEPTDDHAAIVESWYRECCQRDKSAVSVDLGPVDLECPRNALADLVESEVRWPADPTPLRKSLDEIAGSELRK